jgi:hypothetical protein
MLAILSLADIQYGQIRDSIRLNMRQLSPYCGGETMSFGKRRDFVPAPPRGPAALALPPSSLPSSRRIGPNLIQIGSGEDDATGGAARIVRFLLETYNDDGVNAETILSAAGALAGFAAQQAIWEGYVRTGKLAAEQAIACVKTKSGETYFFGDLLNTILASTKEGHLSIWTFVAGAAMSLDAPTLPPVAPMFEHCAATVGTPAFGIPVLPSHIRLKEMPRQALRHWPQVKSILLSAGLEPLRWPLEIGVAAQKIIVLTKDALPADFGALVVMQAAIPMSKVDPRTVPGGTMVE